MADILDGLIAPIYLRALFSSETGRDVPTLVSDLLGRTPAARLGGRPLAEAHDDDPT